MSKATSKQYTGTLQYQDIGPGTWILVDESGDRYMLYIDREKLDVSSFSEGGAVSITGRQIADFSFAMSGKGGIEVDSID